MTLSRFLSRHALPDAAQAPLWSAYLAAPSDALLHRLVLANGSLAVRVAKSLPFSWARRHREDLIQTGLASLVRCVPLYQPRFGAPSKFFSTVIHRDVVREAKRLRAVVQADALSGNWFRRAAPTIELDALDYVSAIGSTQMVPDTTAWLFDRLSPKQAWAVRLAVFAERTATEIGVEMGISKQAANIHKQRGLDFLAAAIAREAA